MGTFFRHSVVSKFYHRLGGNKCDCETECSFVYLISNSGSNVRGEKCRGTMSYIGSTPIRLR